MKIGVTLTVQKKFEAHYDKISEAKEKKQYCLEVAVDEKDYKKQKKVAVFAKTATIKEAQIGFLMKDDKVDLVELVNTKEVVVEEIPFDIDNDDSLQYDFFLAIQD